MNPLNQFGNRKVEAFTFSGQAVLGASVAGNITFNVDSSYDFFLRKFTYVASSATVLNGIQIFNFNIRDNTNSIFSAPADALAFNGVYIDTASPLTTFIRQGENKSELKPARMFWGGGVIIIDIQNLIAAAQTVQFVLDGLKVYK